MHTYIYNYNLTNNVTKDSTKVSFIFQCIHMKGTISLSLIIIKLI